MPRSSCDAGDAPATVAMLYRSSWTELCRLASSYVGSRDIAQDVVHEVFRRLLERLERSSSLRINRSYLRHAVRKEALHWLERRRIRLNWRERAAHAAANTLGPSPADELHARTLAVELNAAVDALPPRCRQAFSLVRIENGTYADAARTMGISVKTVSEHLRRAHSLLRERLAHYAPDT
ncbi:MAG TPA: sigma-70 family RNA polymerase sigma factor [Longimicrobiales bacterium]